MCVCVGPHKKWRPFLNRFQANVISPARNGRRPGLEHQLCQGLVLRLVLLLTCELTPAYGSLLFEAFLVVIKESHHQCGSSTTKGHIHIHISNLVCVQLGRHRETHTTHTHATHTRTNHTHTHHTHTHHTHSTHSTYTHTHTHTHTPTHLSK